jgi:hypothetical protein
VPRGSVRAVLPHRGLCGDRTANRSCQRPITASNNQRTERSQRAEMLMRGAAQARRNHVICSVGRAGRLGLRRLRSAQPFFKLGGGTRRADGSFISEAVPLAPGSRHVRDLFRGDGCGPFEKTAIERRRRRRRGRRSARSDHPGAREDRRRENATSRGCRAMAIDARAGSGRRRAGTRRRGDAQRRQSRSFRAAAICERDCRASGSAPRLA